MRTVRLLSFPLVLTTPADCSPGQLAVNAVGNALSGGTSGFASDYVP